MTCPEDRISAWLDGELTEDEAHRVERHVRDCASCHELVASFRGWTFSMLEPDPGFIVRFRERRDQRSVAPWWTWRQLALRMLPVAAAVLVAALAALSFSPAPVGALRDLEREALGAPVVFDAGPEAVLNIAFEPFPEGIE